MKESLIDAQDALICPSFTRLFEVHPFLLTGQAVSYKPVDPSQYDGTTRR